MAKRGVYVGGLVVVLGTLCLAGTDSGVSSTASALAATSTHAPNPELEITEWPRNLRTDLKGSVIKVALPENEPDRPWNDALVGKFQELTGIAVQVIRPGSDTTKVLSSYLRQFESGSPEADVYAIDIVWPGILSRYAEDLRPTFGNLRDVIPSLVQNDTVKERLVAVPYFIEVSLLYYRRDLLAKYHFARPPLTWSELEGQSKAIMAGEHAHGDSTFWGYLWQGAASEALTCNALEWQISQGGGQLLSSHGALDLRRAETVSALERARRWIGTISPTEVTDQLEDDSLRIWTKGEAAFMRNWPYAYSESMRPESRVKDRIGITVMPKGDGRAGQHADMLGGFQLMISRTSKSKSAGIELIRFLTSPEIQRVNAISRGYAPTRSALYKDQKILQVNPLFGPLRNVLEAGAAVRPSTAAGPQYEKLSTLYFTAMREALLGKKTADDAVRELEKQLPKVSFPGDNRPPDQSQ